MNTKTLEAYRADLRAQIDTLEHANCMTQDDWTAWDRLHKELARTYSAASCTPAHLYTTTSVEF